ncbi:hypothetical protein FXN80_18955 [Dickeya fangzhongdai]|uniref:hypothetical protein n=1 Tax=Dickeya fangzhongdai TaxID=1778540 RepID=UPI00136FC990|nr:hypothetical protein [Dickeya fangzhongdai]UMB76129.1 hypothetical protein FXN80_18955 [Dickeya fangzhongdai]
MAIEVRQLTIYSRVIQPNEPDSPHQAESDVENRDAGPSANPSATPGAISFHHLQTEPRER